MARLVPVILLVIVHTAALTANEADHFPTLDALRGYGSLLDRFSTHDGEWRSVPGVSVLEECSTDSVMITRVTFIALPGVGNSAIELSISVTPESAQSISFGGASQSFGEYGYDLVLEPAVVITMNSANMFWINQPHYEESGLRLLHQGGDEILNISWRWLEENPQDIRNDTDYDYPLLAIETDPPGCIEGLLNTTELRNMWENRPSPVVYSSPYREIPLNCSGPGNLTRLLAGTYRLLPGDQSPQVEVDQNVPICSLSSQPALDEDLNVYECVPDSPVEVSESDSLHILQRHSDAKIVFFHDGLKDVPLISADISGGCSGFLSEDDLREKASMYIPTFKYLEGDKAIFSDLTINQDGHLVKWTFIAKHLGQGGEYPSLQLYRNVGGNRKYVPGLNHSAPMPTIYPNVYESIIENPLLVYAGDIIGFNLPSVENAQLLFAVLLNYGSFGGGSILSGELIEGLPLVSLEIRVSSSSNTSLLHTPARTISTSSTALSTSALLHATPSTVLPPSSPTETVMMCRNTTQEDNIVLMIILVGLSCLLIGATIIIILLLGLILNLRRKVTRLKLGDTAACARDSHRCKTKTDSTKKNLAPACADTRSAAICNPALETVSLNGDLHKSITTHQNEAYVANITATANSAYGAVKSGKVEDSLEYDYVLN